MRGCSAREGEPGAKGQQGRQDKDPRTRALSQGAQAIGAEQVWGLQPGTANGPGCQTSPL